VTGGGTLRLGGSTVSITSIGNPLTVLVLLVVARAAWPPRRSWARFVAWERSLADRHRVLLWATVVPISLWLLLPPHLRGFVDFVENRASGPSVFSAAGLLFYWRAFVGQYHAWKAVGWAAAVGALAALPWLGRTTAGVRALLLAVCMATLALTCHPYKEERFLLVSTPALWLAASWSVVRAVEAMVVRVVPTVRHSIVLVNAAIAAIVLSALAWMPAIDPSLQILYARYTVPASTRPMLDRVVHLGAERSTIILGTWNQASPALFVWRSLQLRDRAPEVYVPSRRGGNAEALQRRFRRHAHGPQIIFLEHDPIRAPSPEWAAAYVAETAWLQPLRRDLDDGLTPYRLAHTEDFTEAGYRIRVYRIASDVSPASSPAG
jgi:hypothetical protein